MISQKNEIFFVFQSICFFLLLFRFQESIEISTEFELWQKSKNIIIHQFLTFFNNSHEL